MEKACSSLTRMIKDMFRWYLLMQIVLWFQLLRVWRVFRNVPGQENESRMCHKVRIKQKLLFENEKWKDQTVSDRCWKPTRELQEDYPMWRDTVCRKLFFSVLRSTNTFSFRGRGRCFNLKWKNRNCMIKHHGKTYISFFKTTLQSVWVNMYQVCGSGQHGGATRLHQHPSTENTMMDGAVSGFSGAVASSRFVGSSIEQSAAEYWRAQKNRSFFFLPLHRLIS